MAKKSFKRWANLWHRRIGVASALVVLMLSVTGLLLNHTSELGLSSKKLSRATASWFYSEHQTNTTGQKLKNQWLFSLEDNVYLGQNKLQPCHSDLVGAVWHKGYLFVACESALNVYDTEYRLQESISQRLGYPAGVKAVGSCGGLCVQTEAGVYYYDFERGVFITAEKPVNWKAFEPLPDKIAHKLPSHFSFEQMVLDIHAGRFLGSLGPLVLDVFTLFFLFLSVSGVYMWSKKGQKSRKRL